MVAGDRNYMRRETPSEPYQEAIYHSSLLYVKSWPWGTSAGKQKKSKFGHLAVDSSKEWKVSPRPRRASSECSEHLALPERLSPSLALLPSKPRSSTPSASPSASDVTLPSMPPSSMLPSSRYQEDGVERRGEHSPRAKAESPKSSVALSVQNGHQTQSVRSSSSKSSSGSSSASSFGSRLSQSKASRENGVDYIASGSRLSSSSPQGNGLEFSGDVENGSLSGSEASTVVQGSDATSQCVTELQQSIKAIQEDNSTMTANLQNLRELVEKQTAKLKQQEEKASISGIEQQLAEIQERVQQQGEQLEGIRSNGNTFASRISALEDTEGQLGNQLGDLETRLAGRISGLEETWSQYSGVEERLGVRISHLEEARSQRTAMESKLSGRIDALEQHLRATNTNIGE